MTTTPSHDCAPIEPKDIRKGDRIRWERDKTRPVSGAEAVEYVATADGHAWSRKGDYYYLMHRPKPPVMVPASVVDDLHAAIDRRHAGDILDSETAGSRAGASRTGGG